ncbi:hypothetical protein CH63R_11608 [Colletotrichum higginsianum IMI 349063]|uniref:Uncharacterized protein n=1 Tax=Colletotrichum higginsianum (strain IMI 349063) TaxID=759273 RepID=A0A1B7XYR9_COLHI|nr:hypothetical protein CH63R_11608 [Colletotrichum higginsianum IMI 349063]OBR04905.1 hypothetical protein CH63R_11608 [Colletotrichum higginsianum IMI 349063]
MQQISEPIPDPRPRSSRRASRQCSARRGIRRGGPMGGRRDRANRPRESCLTLAGRASQSFGAALGPLGKLVTSLGRSWETWDQESFPLKGRSWLADDSAENWSLYSSFVLSFSSVNDGLHGGCGSVGGRNHENDGEKKSSGTSSTVVVVVVVVAATVYVGVE